MWATKRKGPAGSSTSKKKAKSSEDELHDFIHDIEYSAKKILKQHMKRKVKEAARDKMIEQRNRIKANKLKSSSSHGATNGMGMSSPGGAYSTLGQSGAMPSPGSTLGGSTWGPQTDEPGAMGHSPLAQPNFQK